MGDLKRDLCLGVVRGLAISEKAALKAFLVLVVQYRELGNLYNNLLGLHSSRIMTFGNIGGLCLLDTDYQDSNYSS